MEISMFPALRAEHRGKELIIAISDTVYEQTSITLSQDNDTVRLYLNREQLEQLFGKINNYFEDKAIPQPTVNDLAKEMAENAPYSLA